MLPNLPSPLRAICLHSPEGCGTARLWLISGDVVVFCNLETMYPLLSKQA